MIVIHQDDSTMYHLGEVFGDAVHLACAGYLPLLRAGSAALLLEPVPAHLPEANNTSNNNRKSGHRSRREPRAANTQVPAFFVGGVSHHFRRAHQSKARQGKARQGKARRLEARRDKISRGKKGLLPSLPHWHHKPTIMRKTENKKQVFPFVVLKPTQGSDFFCVPKPSRTGRKNVLFAHST